MGILGMGRIGRGIRQIAWAMEMTVLYNDLVNVSPLIDYPAKSVPKPELYEKADILTVHVNHQPDNLNYHLVDATVFSRMKPTALFLNTSRGEVVDANDLATALKTNRITSTASTSTTPEPPPPDYPLWGCPNLWLAPHFAARTQNALDRMSWVARNVVEFLLENRT